MGEGRAAVLMGRTSPEALLAILANPPLTGGTRTRRRVGTAASVLGYAEVDISNLFSIPSQATGCIKELGVAETGWLAAQADISDKLATATAVLLGYGTTAPTGAARSTSAWRSAGCTVNRQRWNSRSGGSVTVPVTPRAGSAGPTAHSHPDFSDALKRSLVAATLRPSAPPARLLLNRGQHGPRERVAELV